MKIIIEIFLNIIVNKLFFKPSHCMGQVIPVMSAAIIAGTLVSNKFIKEYKQGQIPEIYCCSIMCCRNVYADFEGIGERRLMER